MDIRHNTYCPLLAVLCAHDELETRAVGIVVADFVGDWNEEAGVGDAVLVDADGGGDVGSDCDVGARDGGHGEVYGGVWEGAFAV